MDSSDSDSNIFEVDRILDHSRKAGSWFYKVRWQGYGSEEDTWEPEQNLLTCQEIVEHYWSERGKKPKKYQNVSREESSDLESALNPEAPPKTRKRGRPPKKRKSPEAAESHEEERKYNSITTSEDEDIPMIVKRKPGRPKKHENNKAQTNDLDSPEDSEKDAVGRKRGRPPRKKTAAAESISRPASDPNTSEDEDIPPRNKRRPGKSGKAGCELDRSDLQALPQAELNFLLNMEDIAPRGMTRQASKEIALVRMRNRCCGSSTGDESLARPASGGGRNRAIISSGDDAVSHESDATRGPASSPVDVIEISSQTTEDGEHRTEYIVISSQSGSESEVESGQASRGDLGASGCHDKRLDSSEDISKESGTEEVSDTKEITDQDKNDLGASGCHGERLDSSEDISKRNATEEVSDTKEITDKDKNECSLSPRFTTDQREVTKSTEKFLGEDAKKVTDFPVDETERGELPDDWEMSTAIKYNSEKDKAVTGSEASKETNGEPGSIKLNKLDKLNRLGKLSKLLAGYRRSASQPSLGSKETSQVDTATEDAESSRGPLSEAPSIPEEAEDVSRNIDGSTKTTPSAELFEKLTTGEELAQNVEGNSKLVEGNSKLGVCTDDSKEQVTGDKVVRSSRSDPVKNRKNAGKITNNERSAAEGRKTPDGGDVVAKQPHSRSNVSSALVTQLSVPDTSSEGRSRTSPRSSRKSCRSQSAGPVMEGDLLGSIMQQGIQNNDKASAASEKRPGDTKGNKGETANYEQSVSLERMTEDISDDDLEVSDFEFDLDDFSPEDFYRHPEERPAKKSPSPVVAPLDVPLGTLKQAIKQGDDLTVRRALAAGCDVDKILDGTSGMTLLMWAAAADQDKVVRLLLKNGANANVTQKNGTTALMHASEQGFAETVEILLEGGAHINAQQMTGETALMKAAKKGHADVVDILLRKAADTRVQSNFDHSALQLALRSQHFEVHSMITEHEKRLTSTLEVALGKCIGKAGNLCTPPLLSYRCIAPGEDEKMLLHFKYLPARFPQGADVVLFCVKADFYVQDVCLSFSGDNGVRSVVMNGKTQLPVLQGNRSVYVLKPEPENNELWVHTHKTGSRLVVCVYPVSS